MIIILALLAIAAVLWYLSPRGRVVHGAISPAQLAPEPRFPLAALFADASGAFIDLTGERVPIRVSGNSALSYGIRNGDMIIAKHFDDESRKQIDSEDIIIIDSIKGEDDTKPWRIRKVERLYDDANGVRTMKFYPSPTQAVNDKPLSDAVAWIEYIKA